MSSKLIVFEPNASALQRYVIDRDYQSVEESIRDGGPDVDNRFFSMEFDKYGLIYGMTALHVAVAIKSTPIVQLLLESGADVNVSTGYPFGMNGTDFDYNLKIIAFTPLHMAVINKSEVICRLLIAYKADVNAEDHKEKTPLDYCIGNSRLAFLLIKNGAHYQKEHFKNKPLIFKAIKLHKLDLIKFFIENQTRCVYYNNKSPVEFAMDEYPEAVPLLISYGKQLGFSNVRTGDYLIHISVRRRNKEWIRLLCQNGCDPNARDSNRNRALHIAVEVNCSLEIALILLSFGADPNLKNKWGVTPLAYAVQTGNKELTELFLRMDGRLSRNMHELYQAFRFKKFNTAAVIVKQNLMIDPIISFKDESILWCFVKECVGVKDADDQTLSEIMSNLVAMSPNSVINRIDDIWGTLMHFLIYADVCIPSDCYRPLFTSLISSPKCDINQEFIPTDTIKNGELIIVERIIANGSALSFALEMNDCQYYAEELIRLGADYSTIKWDQIYFHPKKVNALKLLVYVGCTFPDNFREYADPTLDPSIPDQDVDQINDAFDRFMQWREIRRTTPLSLKQSSRNAIRRQIGSLGCRRLDSEGSQIFGNAFNPFPKSLVQYILFRSKDSLDI